MNWTNASRVNPVMVLDNYYLMSAHNVAVLWHQSNDYLAVLNIVHRSENSATTGLIDYCAVTMSHGSIDLQLLLDFGYHSNNKILMNNKIINVVINL